jgi:hypothetical protein
LAVVADITVDNIGEFITIRGTAAGHNPPREDRAPHAFEIKDKDGKLIRIVAWPEIFDNVENKMLLNDHGTAIVITAEVTEYKGRLELQLHDWKEIRVGETTATTSIPVDTNTSSPSAVASKPVPAAHETETTKTKSPPR